MTTETPRCEHGKDTSERCHQTARWEVDASPVMPGVGTFVCDEHKEAS